MERSPQPPKPPLTQAIETAARAAIERFPGDAPPEVLAKAALWCKFTEGKLRFAVGKESADLPFSGWSRTLQPPPFVCPHTGMATFHLAATDDGRIAAADQIEPCAETGRRMLKEELVTSSLSGRRALARHAKAASWQAAICSASVSSIPSLGPMPARSTAAARSATPSAAIALSHAFSDDRTISVFKGHCQEQNRTKSNNV